MLQESPAGNGPSNMLLALNKKREKHCWKIENKAKSSRAGVRARLLGFGPGSKQSGWFANQLMASAGRRRLCADATTFAAFSVARVFNEFCHALAQEQRFDLEIPTTYCIYPYHIYPPEISSSSSEVCAVWIDEANVLKYSHTCVVKFLSARKQR